MKRWHVLFLAFILVFTCAACGQGQRPAIYTEELLQSGALLSGVRVADGYIYFEPGEGCIKKLNLQGESIWEKTNPFVREGEPPYLHVYEDNVWDGFFAICDASSNKPVLARMDADGGLLWAYEYVGTSYCALQYAFTLPDGSVVAVGYDETRSHPNEAGPSSLLLLKLSAEGELLQQKLINLDNSDYAHMAQYIPEHGIFVHNGHNGHHLLLLDDDFEILWDRILYKHPSVYADYKGEDDFVRDTAVLGKTIFYSYHGEWSESMGHRVSRLRTLDMKGKAREVKGLPDDMQLIGPAGEYMAVTGEKGVCLLDTAGKVVLELPVPGWEKTPHAGATGGMMITHVLKESDGYTVVYDKFGEPKPQYAVTSYRPLYRETVYAGYDSQGQLLWNYGYTH